MTSLREIKRGRADLFDWRILAMIPLVYHSGYNITAFGLERLHPFDSRKYRRIHDALIARGFRRSRDFTRLDRVSRQDLLKLPTPEYLRSLRRADSLARILEVPVVRRLPSWMIDWRVLRPMRCATGGTILACRQALEHGVAINLDGGRVGRRILRVCRRPSGGEGPP